MKRLLLLVSLLFSWLISISGSGVLAQANVVPVTILRDEDRIIVYIPGNTPVSLAGFAFEVTNADDTRTVYALDSFGAFDSFDFNSLPTPICLRLEREQSNRTVPQVCRDVDVTKPVQNLGDFEVFWYDHDNNEAKTLLITSGVQIIKLCEAGVSNCDIDYVPQNITPLTEATAPIPATPTQAADISSTSTETCIGQVSTNGRNANIRSGPGDVYLPIGGVPNGGQINLIGFSGGENWIQVQVTLPDGQMLAGWIRGWLIAVPETCNLPNLNVRELYVPTPTPLPTPIPTLPITNPLPGGNLPPSGGGIVATLIPPTSPPAPDKVGLDIGTYCGNVMGGNNVEVQNGEWVCIDGGGNVAGIDLNAVCSWQGYPHLGNDSPGNPYTYYCYR